MEVLQWDQLDKLDQEEWVKLDVRYPEELAVFSVPGAINIPVTELRGRLDELPKDKKILCICGTGRRSYLAVRILRQKGFDAVNLSGGISIQKLMKKPETMTKQTDFPIRAKPVSSAGMSERQIDYQLDACGLQCPGPILKLYNKVSEMKDGEVVEIKATDLALPKTFRHGPNRPVTRCSI